MSMEVMVGQLVRSKSGRDKGRYFLIYRVSPDGGFILVVDGDKRGINNPKKKNLRHVQVTNTIVREFAEQVAGGIIPRDQDVRRYLKEFAVD